MPESLIIETDLKEVLNRLDQRFDRFEQKLEKMEERFDRHLQKIDECFQKLDERLAGVETNQARMEEKLDNLDKRVERLEGSQNWQVWTLIGIIGTAIIGTVIRFVLLAWPQS